MSTIEDLFDRHRDAWNRGDGAAYGATFAADATYVSWLGTLYRGGEDIGRSHQALFDSYLKHTRMTVEILDIRHYGPDAAVVTTRGDVARKSPRRLTKVQTYTVVRQDGEWRIAAFQNTKHARLREAVSFKLQPETGPC